MMTDDVRVAGPREYAVRMEKASPRPARFRRRHRRRRRATLWKSEQVKLFNFHFRNRPRPALVSFGYVCARAESVNRNRRRVGELNFLNARFPPRPHSLVSFGARFISDRPRPNDPIGRVPFLASPAQSWPNSSSSSSSSFQRQLLSCRALGAAPTCGSAVFSRLS